MGNEVCTQLTSYGAQDEMLTAMPLMHVQVKKIHCCRVHPELLKHPKYIKARLMDDIRHFDFNADFIEIGHIGGQSYNTAIGRWLTAVKAR